jgi:hypothetical protein
MTHKNVWIVEEAPPKGVRLSIRMERKESEKPSEWICAIELDYPSLEKKQAFPITKDLFKRIEEGIEWIRELEWPDFRRSSAGDRPTSIQHRCEDKETGLVIMCELSEIMDKGKVRYKLGNGAGLDYVFEDLDALDRFTRKLRRAVSQV